MYVLDNLRSNFKSRFRHDHLLGTLGIWSEIQSWSTEITSCSTCSLPCSSRDKWVTRLLSKSPIKRSHGGSWEKPVSCTWKSHIPHCYRRLFFSSLWPSHAGSWSNCCASGNHLLGWVVNRWQQINAYYCKIMQTKTKFTVIHWLCRCMFCMNYSAGILNRSQSRLELLCTLEARSIQNQCDICYTFS